MKLHKPLPSIHNQSGAALAMALTILVILTLLGVSAMKSSSLEIKMATGLQDHTAVFQAADSGLAYAFANGGVNPSGEIITTYNPTPGITAQVTTKPVGSSGAGRGSGDNVFGAGYEYINWEQVSIAQIPSSGARSTVRQGINQLKKTNN